MAIYPNPEKLSLSKTLSIDALDLGRDYHVFGIYFQSETDVLRQTLNFTIEFDDGIISSVPASFFSVINSEIPRGWHFFERADGSVAIHPDEFENTPLLENLADGKKEALEVICRIKKTMGIA